jgi:hypothetical protein
MSAIVETQAADFDEESGQPYKDSGYLLGGANGIFSAPDLVCLSLCVGSKYNGDNGGFLNVGSTGKGCDPKIATQILTKPVLLALADHWDVDWACAQAFSIDYEKTVTAPGVPPLPYTIFHIPWMAYLSAPLAVELDLPSEIVTECRPNGGLFMIGTPSLIDLSDPGQMRRAHIITQTLLDRVGQPSWAG